MFGNSFFLRLCEESFAKAHTIFPKLILARNRAGFGAGIIHSNCSDQERMRSLASFRDKYFQDYPIIFREYYNLFSAIFEKEIIEKNLLPQQEIPHPQQFLSVINIPGMIPHLCCAIMLLINALQSKQEHAGCGEGAMIAYAYLAKRVFSHFYISQLCSQIKSLDMVELASDQHSDNNHAVILVNSQFRTLQFQPNSTRQKVTSPHVFGNDCTVVDSLHKKIFSVQETPPQSILANINTSKPLYVRTLISSEWLFQQIQIFPTLIKAYIFSVYMHFLQVSVREDLARYNHWQYKNYTVAQTESTSLARINQLTNAQFIGRIQTSDLYPISAGKIDRRDKNWILDALCEVKLDTPEYTSIIASLCNMWIPFNFKFHDGKVYLVIEAINVADEDGGCSDTVNRRF